MSKFKIAATLFLATFFFMGTAYPDDVQPQVKAQQPYRTFIMIQRYSVENSGNAGQSVSNVRLEITFPNEIKTQLPENGQYWPIGNGQAQEINRTFELPFALVQNDSFRFRIQMIRHGGKLLPCEFDVASLSQFNRSYVCHTDTNWQANQKVASDRIDNEGIQIRIFTDKNSQPGEIPRDSIALRQ